MLSGHDGLLIEVGVKDLLHYSVNAIASVTKSPVDSRLNMLRATTEEDLALFAACLKSNWRFSQLWVSEKQLPWKFINFTYDIVSISLLRLHFCVLCGCSEPT
jgi:hypothetical protein